VRSVFDKLEQAFALANEQDAQVVILGDLFDRARESSLSLLHELLSLLMRLRHKAIVLVGNHDRTGSVLTADASLSLLRAAGAAWVVDDPQGFDLDGLALWCVPYGREVPRSLPRQEGRLSVMVTHHDWAIAPNMNPKAEPIFEIAGCDLVVNGHDHKHKAPARAGSTLYFNPGNISRIKVDQLRETPRVFLLSQEELEPSADQGLFEARAAQEVFALGSWRMQSFELSCAAGEEVFDLTGYNVEASTDEALAAYLSAFSQASEAQFIEALKSCSEIQAAGGGGGLVKQIIREVAQDLKVDDVVREMLEDLLSSLAQSETA